MGVGGLQYHQIKSMNYNKTHSVIFLLLTSIVSSCNRSSKCECESFKPIPESTKEWYDFKDSSYWVFRMLEDTTQIDTVSQLFIQDESSLNSCNHDYNNTMTCAERKKIFYNHSNTKLFPSYNPVNTKYGYHFLYVSSPGDYEEILSLESGSPNLNLHGWLFSFPIKLNQKIGYYFISDSIENYSINNLKFNSTTLHIKSEISPIIKDIIKEVWWTKGVGMVKYIKSEGKTPKATWELVDYNIIK